MATQTESVDGAEQEDLPYESITYDALRERSPFTSEAHQDPTGGVVVHRCHPQGEREDFFAFAMYHETMKGYEDKRVYCYQEAGERAEGPGIGRWNDAVASYQFREGSHEDCDVCQGESSDTELIQEVIEQIHPVDLERAAHGVAYLDCHGKYSSGGTYDVDNRMDCWTVGSHSLGSLVTAHPYVYVQNVSPVGENDQWYSPDNTLKVEFGAHYPADEGVLV